MPPRTPTPDDAPATAPDTADQPLNTLPYDAMVHIGAGVYVLVPRGAPWPTNNPQEG